MKHAGHEALSRIRDLLEAVRQRNSLVERTPGVFYFRSGAFLHFHEDPAGIFADLKDRREWERHPIRSEADYQTLLARVDAILARASISPGRRSQVQAPP